jgi:chromosome segregation ATPase
VEATARSSFHKTDRQVCVDTQDPHLPVSGRPIRSPSSITHHPLSIMSLPSGTPGSEVQSGLSNPTSCSNNQDTQVTNTSNSDEHAIRIQTLLRAIHNVQAQSSGLSSAFDRYQTSQTMHQSLDSMATPQDITRFKASLAKDSVLIEKFLRVCVRLGAEVDFVSKGFDNAKAKMDKLASDKQEIERELASRNDLVKKGDEALRILAGEIGVKNTRIGELEGRITQKDAELEANKTIIADLKKSNADKDAQIRELERQIADLKESV